MQSKKRALVTGGAGFIGSFICERLLSEGCKVICLDNFYTGREENIRSFLSNPDFELLNHDLVEPVSLSVDWIFNFACPASPVHYQADPIKTWKTSVIGILNMLELAHEQGAAILHASTSEVYGDPIEHPQTETYWGNVNPIGIRSCYDEGKRAAESLICDYRRVHNIDAKIIRIFNTYGPRMRYDDGRVVSNLIVQALRGEDLTIYGDGNQTRSFCYVDNLVEVIFRIMKKESFYGPVNCGNPDEFTILELASKVIEITNSKSKIIFKPLPKDDPTQRKPDITIAKKELGWEPTVALDEGLKYTIAHFEEWLRSNGI